MSSVMVRMADGAALRTWTVGADSPDRRPVLLIHGGPGIPDYLGPVAACLQDAWLVHRYDQRGVGGSPWEGEHSLEQAVTDVVSLLDHWGHEKVTLVGHSFGTNLAAYVTLAHPERVAGLVQIAGPFLGPRWRAGQVEAEQFRRSPTQQARFEELGAKEHLTELEDIEFLTLAWFTNYADTTRAWQWAGETARALRPVNATKNRQLNAAKRATPLEDRLEELRTKIPAQTVFIGGTEDPRPQSELDDLAHRLGVELVMIPEAGHEPWLDQPARFRAAIRDAVRRQ